MNINSIPVLEDNIENARYFLQKTGLENDTATTNTYNELVKEFQKRISPDASLLILLMLIDTVIMIKDKNADREERRQRALELTLAFYTLPDMAEVIKIEEK